jgi:hypothetical protein
MKYLRVIWMTVGLLFLADHAMAADFKEQSTSAGIRYVSGGVSQPEADAMRAAAKGYSLDVMFATDQGNFISAVQVKIRQGGDKEVLSTVTEGPMLLVDLPPGNYVVEASAEGKSFNQQVSIAAGQHRSLSFRWPSQAQ